jgi:hypothetical protein
MAAVPSTDKVFINQGAACRMARPSVFFQRGRPQDRLVAQRSLVHRPDHQQLAIGAHGSGLPRVQGQLVAQHASRLAVGDLRHGRHVVGRRDALARSDPSRSGASRKVAVGSRP